ncbi:hypothetical protein [Blastopirellula marina]|uniref:Uncharacterized protein n=1 Tax=Blastopirellula marina TaxID=124 RepID=A0A2S8FWD8_9BACT|nr:hypothetical protein [Blastopirellula marina]PQO36488.1 hypothetical protein C5Y98_12365 [Blastopirellula marina]PQO47438.1 hypothetical protein C5Y93_05180 [Blastopirellula marina]PTL44325.1 hypothetical protein C5Y97_12375 [Blastopirellula marina]
MIRLLGMTSLGVLLLVSTVAAQMPGQTKARSVAQNAVSLEKASEKKPPKADKADKDAAVSESEQARREELAFDLVRTHHPELSTLLRPLKRLRPRQYEAAIRELSRVSERLTQIQQRQPERYEIELALWKSKSRIQLLTAQLQMTPDDDKLREKLRSTIAEQIVSQRQLYEFEKARLAQRIEFLDAQLEKMDGDVETLVDQRLKAVDPLQKKPAKFRDSSPASSEKPKK